MVDPKRLSRAKSSRGALSAGKGNEITEKGKVSLLVHLLPVVWADGLDHSVSISTGGQTSKSLLGDVLSKSLFTGTDVTANFAGSMFKLTQEFVGPSSDFP